VCKNRTLFPSAQQQQGAGAHHPLCLKLANIKAAGLAAAIPGETVGSRRPVPFREGGHLPSGHGKETQGEGTGARQNKSDRCAPVEGVGIVLPEQRLVRYNPLLPSLQRGEAPDMVVDPNGAAADPGFECGDLDLVGVAGRGLGPALDVPGPGFLEGVGDQIDALVEVFGEQDGPAQFPPAFLDLAGEIGIKGTLGQSPGW